jgi:ABC-type uncharacterized transport system substrate-binding protein
MIGFIYSWLNGQVTLSMWSVIVLALFVVFGILKNTVELAFSWKRKMSEWSTFREGVAQWIHLKILRRNKEMKIIHIGLVLNGEMPYSRRMLDGFKEEAERLLFAHRQFPHFVTVTGSALGGEEGNTKNADAFKKLFDQFPDGRKIQYLVTFGTEVSVYAKSNFSDVPHIFVGVTDPINCKLVTSLNAKRPERIAGTCYGDLEARNRLILALLAGGRIRRLGFVYNPELSQDELAFKRTKSFIDTLSIAPTLVPIRTSGPELTAEQMNSADAFFGWSFLNQSFSKFASRSFVGSEKKPFFGVSYDDASQFAVASVCPDEKELGRQAALAILKKSHIHGERLGNIPILPPAKNLQFLNRQLLKDADLEAPPQEWKAPHVFEIVDGN